MNDEVRSVIEKHKELLIRQHDFHVKSADDARKCAEENDKIAAGIFLRIADINAELDRQD